MNPEEIAFLESLLLTVVIGGVLGLALYYLGSRRTIKK